MIHLPATGALRGALIFTHFWGFRKFRGALIFFKNLAEILGSVYLHEFWWGALIFTFFLVDFSKDLHCKTPVLQKFSRCAGQISGERLFSHFFEERLFFFNFQILIIGPEIIIFPSKFEILSSKGSIVHNLLLETQTRWYPSRVRAAGQSRNEASQEIVWFHVKTNSLIARSRSRSGVKSKWSKSRNHVISWKIT